MSWLLLSLICLYHSLLNGFAPDTLIVTPTGLECITNIQPDYPVKTFNFEHKSVSTNRILAKARRTFRSSTIIILDNGEKIQALKFQKFYLNDLAIWKSAQDLKRGDRLFSLYGIPIHVHIKSLIEGYYMNITVIKNFENENEIFNSHIYISNSADKLEDEVDVNMWAFSLSDDLLQEMNVVDLEIFYLWFDEQAMQLRFNLISDVHHKLPFNAKVNHLSFMRPILEKYISAARLIISGDTELEFDIKDDEEDLAEYLLDVYLIKLPQEQAK